MDPKITATITSYNRFHLLDKCIRSFLQTDIKLLDRIIVGEDSTNLLAKSNIENLITSLSETYNKIELQFNETNLRQAANIDKLYSKVKTPYILHLEDDYVFDGPNKNFIADSINILEERSDRHAVWIRCLDNYNESHNTPDARVFCRALEKTTTGVEHREFFHSSIGLSWMPNIHRLADYQRWFPQGYGPLVQASWTGTLAEATCGVTLNNIYIKPPC